MKINFNNCFETSIWSIFKSKTVMVLFLLFVSTSINAQCDDDDFMDKCSSALEEFNFIKSYEFENEDGEGGEYSYVFSKGSKYRIIICDQNIAGNRMIVTLLDRNHKVIVSSYSKSSKKYFPSITYPCSATGVYYIQYSFEGTKAKCGVNILGFSKQ